MSPTTTPTQTPLSPTSGPTSSSPTFNPTTFPSLPGATNVPTATPTTAPTQSPTVSPTTSPTHSPTYMFFAPPEVSECRYQNDGSAILIFLSALSDKGFLRSPFVCDSLLDFEGTRQSSCLWNANGSVISILPSAAVHVALSATIYLRGGIVRAACPLWYPTSICRTWRTANRQSCIVKAPLNAIVPEVIISAPGSIGSCDGFLLDLSHSLGSGRREWTVFTVNVTSSEIARNASDIETFYKTNYAFSPPTLLPASYLEIVTYYTFTVTLCNFFGKCHSASHFLHIVDIDFPVVLIAGSPKRDIRVYHAVALSSYAYVANCDGAVINTGVRYTWLVYEQNAPLGIVSVANSPYRFRLNPFTFHVGHTYDIVVTASYDLSPVESTATVRVYVIPSNVVAKIAGATSRALRFGESVEIDASLSYDEDVFHATGAAAGLMFSWSCVSFDSGVQMAQCGVSVTPNDSKVTVSLLTQNFSVLSTLLVNVSNAHGRYDTASVDISAIAPQAPVVVLSVNSSKVLISNKVKIFAVVESQSSFTAQWHVSDNTINLQSVAITPTTAVFSAAGTYRFNIALPGNILYSGVSFTFTLSTSPGSSTAITVDVVGPPLAGTFAVAPSEGLALKDVFVLSVARWQDTELPLTYSFGYITPRMTVASLHSRSDVAFFSTKLASVSYDDAASLVRCEATGYNILNAFTSLYFDVTVRSNMISLQDVDDLLADLGNDKAAQTIDAKRIVAIGSSVLNAVNCSLALNCTELNREGCMSIDHSCGPCAEGFVGTDGDDNSLCYLASDVVADMLIASNCTTDNDCAFTQTCHTTADTCKPRSKTCPRDCSGHGVCRIEVTASGNPIHECFISDTTCSAVCGCDVGFSGGDCSVTVADIEHRQNTRHAMLRILQNTSQFDDPSEDLVLEIMDLLTELAFHGYELTVAGCALQIGLVENVIGLARELAMDYEKLQNVYKLLDTCASVSLRENDNNNPEYTPSSSPTVLRRKLGTPSHSILTTPSSSMAFSREGDTTGHDDHLQVQQRYSLLIEEFLGIVKSSLIMGQEDVSFIRPLSRSSVSMQSTLDVYTLTIPLTGAEKATGQIGTQVSMAGDAATESVISLTQTSSRIFSNATPPSTSCLSNPVRVEMSQVSRGSNAQLPPVVITFRNHHYQEYGRVNTSNVTYTTHCSVNDIYWHNYSCPLGGQVSHKCTGIVGNLTTPCPPVLIQPSCRLIVNGSDFTNAEACSVVAYNSTTITCLCSFQPDDVVITRRQRRLHAVSDVDSETEESYEASGGMQTVSMAVYSYEELVDTLYDTEDVTVADLRSAWLVITMFAILWFFGVLALCEDVRFTITLSAAKEKVKMRHRSSAQSLVAGDITGGVNDVRKKYLMKYLEGIVPTVFTNSKSGLRAMVSVSLFVQLATYFTCTGTYHRYHLL